VFPVVAAVLRCPSITPLHDEALAVLGLHVAPEQDIPRGESLELLYAVLGTIPAYRCGRRLMAIVQQHAAVALGVQAACCSSRRGECADVVLAQGLAYCQDS
jgi:hypothetical protein